MVGVRRGVQCELRRGERWPVHRLLWACDVGPGELVILHATFEGRTGTLAVWCPSEVTITDPVDGGHRGPVHRRPVRRPVGPTYADRSDVLAA